MTYSFRNSNAMQLKSLACCALVLLLVTTATAANRSEPPPPPMSAVQVQMGRNAPLGRILSVELSVNSLQLVSSKGATALLVAHPFNMEQSHLTSSSEVVGNVVIRSGTYTRAILNVANPHVVYVDNFGNIREARWVGVLRASALMQRPIAAGAAPLVVRMSLDIASLFHFDDLSQTLMPTQPVFVVSQLRAGRGGDRAEISEELEASVGRVTGVRGMSFTITDAVSGLTTPFLTDRSTIFNGLSLRTMSNLLVRVHSRMRSDNQLLAQEVTVSGSGFGSVVTGVITDASGTKVAMQQVYGAGATAALEGSFGTIAIDPAASYQVDSNGMDMTGLGFTFGPANMVPGQRIQFTNRGAMPNISGGASIGRALTVRLQLQSVSGTVTNVAVGSNGRVSFDLQLPVNDGSALTSLAVSASIVHVFTQPLTKSSVSDFSEGMEITVRGLLFFNPAPADMQSREARAMISRPKATSDTYLVARHISPAGGR